MKLLIIFVAGIAAASALYPYEIELFLVDGNNKFTLDLFREVSKVNPDKSVVMSGFSAMAPLALLGFASTGDSHDEIYKAISMPNDTIIKEVFNLANKEVDDTTGITVKSANSIFIPAGDELNEEIKTTSKDVFRSEVKEIDFSKNIEAAATINKLVEDHTNKRIKDLVMAQSLGPSTHAVLVNALYFKGNWFYDDKFDSALTEDRDFHVTKDKTIKIPTMYRNGEYYFKDDTELGAKVLQIPYHDENAKFLVVLPNEINGIAALEEKLKDPTVLLQSSWNLIKTEVDLYLPKFKIETSIDLKDVLKKIGIKSIFDAKSGVAKLVKSGKIVIDSAIQKVFIEVNEEGAEAAAGSALFGPGASPFIPLKQTFKADHPFLFFIMLGNNILFNGAYYGQPKDRDNEAVNKIFVASIAATSALYPYEIEQFLVDGNNKFTLDVFREVSKANPDKSVVMSGFSAMAPLALLGFASTGDSHDEIYKAISMPNDTITKEVFNLANEKVDDTTGITLKSANSIFIPAGDELNEEIKTTSKDVFRSEVKQVDFSKNIEAAATINKWVEDHTNKRIKDLVMAQSLGPSTHAVLVNALYFKGNWFYDDKFDSALTEDRDFHVTKDKTIKIPTMYRNGKYYFKDETELGAKVLQIPYHDENAKFLVVLPNEINGIAALEEKLKDPTVLLQSSWNLIKTEVDLYLPKFKIETSIDLKDVLKKIGIKSIFDAKSGVAKLVKSGNIVIDSAIQKVFIEVNEEGAEAAAGSAFFGVGASPFIPMKQTFRADHPFLFFIMLRDNILFNGAYYGQDA